MRLSVSNIAWSTKEDLQMYDLLQKEKIKAIEIAPTRLFPEQPYEKLQEAVIFREEIFKKYGLLVSSMQSIWYGRTEKIFFSKPERDALLSYTKSAILFAEKIQCGNLVFGCPKNRILPPNGVEDDIIPFFQELGNFSQIHHTCIGIEANPTIYGTNFLNTTSQVFSFVSRVNSKGVKVNLDVGTMIYNQESPEWLKGKVPYISHVHISEPNLMKIKEREIHHELANILRNEGYDGYISLEMKDLKNIESLKSAIRYLKMQFM